MIQKKPIEIAAENGDADSQYELGICYLFGKNEFHQDNRIADLWIKKAADQGVVDAMRLSINRRTSDWICCPNCHSTKATPPGWGPKASRFVCKSWRFWWLRITFAKPHCHQYTCENCGTQYTPERRRACACSIT